MQEMKTTLDWLKEIPDAEVREKAIANYNDYYANEKLPAENVGQAILRAFCWSGTKEGSTFWDSVHEKYRSYKPRKSEINTTLSKELSEEMERHNKAILEILKKHGK